MKRRGVSDSSNADKSLPTSKRYGSPVLRSRALLGIIGSYLMWTLPLTAENINRKLGRGQK